MYLRVLLKVNVQDGDIVEVAKKSKTILGARFS